MRPSRIEEPSSSTSAAGTAPAREPVETLPGWGWAALLVLLGLWVAWRLGAFHLMSMVTDAAGHRVTLPNTFASVDHPFHIARAVDLLDALKAGEPLRWISNHQGGYPVEFYPLGVAWLDVGLWFALLGHFPLAAVHKLVIILIYLVPGLGYALMARRDGWRLGVALVALAVQVAVPGGAWSGGYVELVDWGMVTNVAANMAVLFVLLWLTTYLLDGHWASATGASIAAAFAIYANPRCLIALAIAGAGVWLAQAIRPGMTRDRLGRQTGRLILVAVVSALLAAPELFSLARFEHLYYFVRYSLYYNAADYIHWSSLSVSWPILLLAIGGVLAGFALPMRPVTRSAAVTLVLYVLATVLLSSQSHGFLVEQLETKRLMPFQRLLELYLAAVALFIGLSWVGAALTPQPPSPPSQASLHWREESPNAGRGELFVPSPRIGRGSPRSGGVRALFADLGMIVAAVLILGVFVGGWGNVPASYRGLYPLQMSAQPALADYEEAVKAADVAAAPGTAILVLGSQISWHEQLWAPLWSNRMFFYDDWLWFWQTKQPGPYNPTVEHAYDPYRMNQALTPAFLREQGIGAVIITQTGRVNGMEAVAGSAPDLQQVRSGLFSVYVVHAPAPIVTFAGASPTKLTVGNQYLSASGASAGGMVLIRRNWFPRWQLTVNGKTVPITETSDGYMQAPIPAGPVTIKLTYAVDWLDWLARAALLVGVLVLIGLAIVQRRSLLLHWDGRSSHARASNPLA